MKSFSIAGLNWKWAAENIYCLQTANAGHWQGTEEAGSVVCAEKILLHHLTGNLLLGIACGTHHSMFSFPSQQLFLFKARLPITILFLSGSLKLLNEQPLQKQIFPRSCFWATGSSTWSDHVRLSLVEIKVVTFYAIELLVVCNAYLHLLHHDNFK